MEEELLAAAGRVRNALHTPATDASIPKDVLDLVPQDFSAEKAIQLIRSNSGSNPESLTDALWATHAILQARKEVLQKGDESDDLKILSETISEHMLPIESQAKTNKDRTSATSLADRGHISLVILTFLTSSYNIRLSPAVLLSTTAYTSLHDPWTTPESKKLAEGILGSHFFSLPVALPSSSDDDDDEQSEDKKEPRRLSLLAPKNRKKEDDDATTNTLTGSDNDRPSLENFITETILHSFLRPLFSHSPRPATVTASGRKAEFVQPARYTSILDDSEEREKKPWKYTHRYAITIFVWAVRNADQTILKSHWHRYTPILLTLLDESPSSSSSSLSRLPLLLKTRTLNLTLSFHQTAPAGLLSSTGLSRVLEDAVFPTVQCLPSLTPEDESLELLAAAYPTLRRGFAGLGGGGGKGKKKKLEEEATTITEEEQERVCDRIVREGIMVGYHHAKSHVRLVGLLCGELREMVLGMGILTVKYLKDIFPVIYEIMTDPFGPQHLPTLHAAVRLLQAVLSTCWPRIATPNSGHANDILRALMLCWLNVQDHFNDDDDDYDSEEEEEERVKKLRADLVKAADMLAAVLDTAEYEADDEDGNEDGDGPLRDRVQPLVQAEPRLQGLFTGFMAATALD